MKKILNTSLFLMKNVNFMKIRSFSVRSSNFKLWADASTTKIFQCVVCCKETIHCFKYIRGTRVRSCSKFKISTLKIPCFYGNVDNMWTKDRNELAFPNLLEYLILTQAILIELQNFDAGKEKKSFFVLYHVYGFFLSWAKKRNMWFCIIF